MTQEYDAFIKQQKTYLEWLVFELPLDKSTDKTLVEAIHELKLINAALGD